MNRSDRVIAIELSHPDGTLHTLMIAKMYGIRGWSCYSAQIRVILPKDQVQLNSSPAES